MFRHLLRFIPRLWAYLPVIWRDEDWDYGYLLEVMQFKLARLRNSLTHHNDDDKHKKRIRIVELLIGRVIASEYGQAEHDEWAKNEPKDWDKMKDIITRVEYSENQDLEMLFNIMKKHIRRWWD